MALSECGTSETSVGGLLDGPRSPRRPGGRHPADVHSWAARDAVQAAQLSPNSPSDSDSSDAGDGGTGGAAVLALRLDVANKQLVRGAAAPPAGGGPLWGCFNLT